MSTIVLDPEKLYMLLDAERRRCKIRWRDIARETGVSPSTLTRIGQGRHPSASALLTLIRWLTIDPSAAWRD